MKDKILFLIDAGLAHFGIAKFLQEKYYCDLFAIIDIKNHLKEFFINQKIVNFQKVSHEIPEKLSITINSRFDVLFSKELLKNKGRRRLIVWN